MTTLIILLCVVALEVIYLHYRCNKHKAEMSDMIDIVNMDMVDVEEKVMEMSKKINEKPRRRSTKRSRKVSKVEVSKSKILRKFRGDKDFLQAGGKG